MGNLRHLKKFMSTAGRVQKKMYICIFCIKQKDTISGLTNNTFDVIVPYLLTLQETELAEGEEKPFNAFLLRVILNSVREISFTY